MIRMKIQIQNTNDLKGLSTNIMLTKISFNQPIPLEDSTREISFWPLVSVPQPRFSMPPFIVLRDGCRLKLKDNIRIDPSLLRVRVRIQTHTYIISIHIHIHSAKTSR